MNFHTKWLESVTRLGPTTLNLALLAFKVSLILVTLLLPGLAWALAGREM